MWVLFAVIALLLLLLSVLSAYMYKEAFSDRVVYHVFAFPNLPKNFGEINIFFISDIHKRIISDQIINEVNGKTELVIIGGDLLEKGVPLEQVEENIKKLKELGQLFFVWGNNDYEIDYHTLDALLLHHGVKILDNTVSVFESEDGDRFILLGVDDLTKERDRLDLALLDAGVGGFRLLVSHNPKISEKISDEQGIDLVLCGHTHGGQIRIFGFGPYEVGGIKKLGNTTMLVSNGYGTTGVPFRLGAKAQTHLITLKNGIK